MPSVRLQTRRQNVAFMVMTALYFALRHPQDVPKIPIKVTRMLFGSGIGVSTLRLLQTLTWQNDAGVQFPVFAAVQPDQPMKVTSCRVTFHSALLEYMEGETPQVCQSGFFHGLTDVTRLAFQYAEKDIEGAWDAWTPQSLEKLFLSELTASQKPQGSTMTRKVKYCPVCRRALGMFFYGSVAELRQITRGISLEKSRFIIGSVKTPEPRPKWMCLGCGIKIWPAS